MRGLIFSLLSAALAMIAASAPAEAPTAPISYSGKTVLITGSTDGLGRALARSLAAEGAHVIVHGRNAERGQALVEEIGRSGVGSASFYAADFASLSAVSTFAETIANNYPRIDLLVNNAGIAIPGGQDRRTSADGHDLQFAVNYLPGWILVNRLRANLAAAAPARVINVSSIAANAIDFDDVMLEKPEAAARGYGQSKLAQVMMTVELAPSFAEQGITMISLHPATLMDTGMVVDLGMAPRATVDEGRDHVLSLAKAPSLEPGAFYVEGRAAPSNNPQTQDAEARQRLVALSEELTGVRMD
jgi:NAD(P)-dependent dehydrogenase (short-subunit alcohol dehydrogenase family)